MAASVDAIPALPQILRAVRAASSTLQERKEAVVALGVLASVHAKSIADPAKRAALLRRFALLWPECTAAREALTNVPGDRLAREQRDGVLAERALRLKTPNVIVQVLCLLTLAQNQPLCIARGIAHYVLPLLVAVTQPAEWAAALAPLTAAAGYFDLARHSALVVERVLVELAGPALAEGADAALTAAWRGLWDDFVAFVARSRARSTVAKKTAITSWPLVVRVARAVPVPANGTVPDALLSATTAAGAKGAVVAAVALVAAGRASTVPRAAVEKALQLAPGAAAVALGFASRVAVESADALLDASLTALCAANVSVGTISDACALIRVSASDDAGVEAVLMENARVQKLLDPVTKSAALYTAALSREVIGALYGRALPLTASLLTKLFATAGSMIASRCSNGDQRASLLFVVFGVLAAARNSAASELPTPQSVQSLLKPVIASPVPEVLAAAWCIAAALPAEQLAPLEPAMAPVFKTAATNEATRRAVFSGVPASVAAAANVAGPFVKDAPTTPAFRPQALLALRLPGAVTASKLQLPRAADGAFTADGLDGLASFFKTTPALVDAAFASAQRLAGEGILRGLAVSAAHRNGSLSRRALTTLRSVTSCGEAMKLWSTVTRDVFGVAAAVADAPDRTEEEATDAIASFRANARELLVVASTCILRHHALVTVDEVLAELLLCLGSPIICGADPLLLVSPEHRYGAYPLPGVASAKCQATLRRIFEHGALPETAEDAIERAAVGAAEKLAAHLSNVNAKTTSHAMAAANAFALLVGLVPAATQESVMQVLQTATRAASEAILGLSAVELALASTERGSIESYYEAELRAKGLIKTFGPKPPKGVSEDDYEDMQRAAAKALAEGRAAVIAATEKTKEKLGCTPQLRTAPFAAIRLVASIPNTVRECSSASLLLWLQESLGTWMGVDKDDKPNAPALLVQSALEAAAALFAQSTSVPYFYAGVFMRVSGRLQQKPITALDAGAANALALKLRLAGVNALPAKLFGALIPVMRGAFRVVTSKSAPQVGATSQHQLMALFAATSAMQDVRGRTEGLDFAVHAITNFGGVYKMASSSMAALAKYADAAELAPLVCCAVTAEQMQREASAIALAGCSALRAHRGTQVALACLLHDPRPAVTKIAARALGDDFALQPSDLPLLLALLRKYCYSTNGVSVTMAAMKNLVTDDAALQRDAVDAIKKLEDVFAAVLSFQALISVLSTDMLIAVINSLADIAEDPETDGDTMKEVLKCGRDALLKSDAPTLKKTITPAVQPRLQGIVGRLSGKGNHTEQLGAIVTSWLTVIATRADDVQYMKTVLEGLPPMLATAATPTVHFSLAECIADLTRHKDMRNSDKVVEFGEHCLKQVLNSTSYVKKKAHANAFAGIILGAGLLALRKFNALELINDAARDKQTQRSGAMVLIETLAQTLGVLFEPYLLIFTQLMLDSIAEKDPKVAECADDAAKAMMASLSDVGVRQLVPRLIEGLQADQNKKKQSSLSLIAYIAYCSPRQLAAALPTIIPHIADCLFDANGGTANAAFAALKRLAGVAKHEIQQHIDVILDAMRYPDSETEVCLDALLYSRFNTAIDVASLALLMPVVSRGLFERESSVRGKAAQIVASLVTLVADPKRALLPYAQDIMTKLQNTAQDPQAGVRATSAKAISRLVSTLSMEHVEESLSWSAAVLQRAGTSSAEKGGAAQTYVEVLGAVGESLLEAKLEAISAGCKDEQASVRESYMNLFVYAPVAFSTEMFAAYLPTLFPFVLEGLADPVEAVRTVALQAGTNIINVHGLRHLDLVLPPLLEGVVAELPSARQSSLLLASKLLIHIVSEHRRKHNLDGGSDDSAAGSGDDEDGMGEGDKTEGSSSTVGENTLRLDSARDAEKGGLSILGHLEEVLGADGFMRLLAAMHIARSEHNAVVRGEVVTAWQVCVASPRTALRKIAPGIVEVLVKFASSERPECVDLAEKCIGYTCQRIHDMIDTFLVAFTKHYHGPTERHRVGALTCIAETVPYSERERIQKFTPQICSAVLPALRGDSEIVRALAASVSERVTKVVGKSWNDDIVQQQLTSESVVGAVEVVRANTKHSLSIIFKALSKRDIPTQFDIDLLSELVALDECASEFVLHYDALCTILCNGVVHGRDGSEEALTSFAEFIIAVEYYPNQFAIFQRLLKTPHTRAAAIRSIAAFFRGFDADAVEGMIQALRLVLQTFGDADGNTRDTTARAFIGMTQNLDEKVARANPELDSTAQRRAAGKFAVQFVDTIQASLLSTIHASCGEEDPELPVLRFPKLVDTVNSYYLRALDYGNPGNKLQALDGVDHVIRHVSATARPLLLNTVMAKCIKSLYERNDGSVISAVVSLLLHAMDYDKTGKNKILERTIASAVFGATLSDSPEARTLGLRLAAELLRRDTLYADLMLAMLVTKKGSLESPMNRSAACRYVAVVMRRGNVQRPVKNLPQLLTVIRPLFENPDMILTASAAGMAMGSLAITSAMSDEEVGALADQAVEFAKSNGARAVGGMACLMTLISHVRDRIEKDIIQQAAAAVRSVLPSCGTDRLTALWALRLASVLVKIDPALLGKLEPVEALMKRVEVSDDLMMSTAAQVVETFSVAVPAIAETLQNGKYDRSGVWGDIGAFEADFEDEYSSTSITY